MNNASEFWVKYWRTIAVMVGFAAIVLIVYALRMVLFPFVVGLALAYIMVPIVSWIEARFPRNWRWLNVKRVSAIAIVYMLIVLVLSVFMFFAVSAVVNAIHDLAHNSVAYFSAASDTLKALTESLRQMVPPEVRTQMDTTIQNMGDALLNSAHSAIMSGIESLPSTLGFIVGLAGVPFFLFYILKDKEKLNGLYSSLPDWARPHAKNILSIVEDAFGRYIRASLMMGLVVGTLTLIGLLLIRAPLALLLAVLTGVTEMIPLVGPWIGGSVAVMVTLALAPDKVIWVVLIVLSVQLLENTLLVPRIQSAFFQIHPAITIVLLMVGVYIAGVWGLVLTLPLTVTFVGLYRYCCQVTQVDSKLVAKPTDSQDNKMD